MNGLTERDILTFGAVADTFFASVPGPNDFWTQSASDLGLLPRFRRLLSSLDDQTTSDLHDALKLLSSRGGGLLMYQRPARFTDLSGDARREALLRMARSPLLAARQLYGTLKQLTTALLATASPGAKRGPLWAAMGYPEPPPAPAPEMNSDVLRLTQLKRTTTLSCDVVVVGSGAGGGVAAAVLAEAGLDVVVLERGDLYRPSEFDWRERAEEPEPMREQLLTRDHGVAIYQGKAVGGGTLINYSTSLQTPSSVRAEWDDATGLGDLFSGASFDAAQAAVVERLGVNTENTTPPMGPRDVVLQRGLDALGWDCKPLPRNAVGCTLQDCGYCGYGCRREAKRSTAHTWLPDAQRAGARIVAGADVHRIRMRGSRAVGVDARVDGSLPLRVDARAVVVACGAIHSPALLLRSGIASRAIGRYLRLHPVTLVYGKFPDTYVDPWSGTMQARISEQFADLDGRGYGVRFETAPLHPVGFAATVPWTSPHAFKSLLAGYRNWSLIGVLLRDRDFGKVSRSKRGATVVDYAMSGRDKAHARQGVIRAAEVLAAAGAQEVLATTHTAVRWRPGAQASSRGFGEALDRASVSPTRMTYVSFHQMGSLRMGADPTRAATDGDARVHGVHDLYVMDASLFPTASGVNPMVSIETLAYQAATKLAERMG